ncbi:MAG TPA: aldehyde dehydrogenase family protein [Phycisphaerae bacterium]|nr:aldehyde dehydrogenase family protein [Phycisphaerae bacterium]
MTAPRHYPFWLFGRPADGSHWEIRSPFDGAVVASVACAGPEQIQLAMTAMRDSGKELARLSAFERREICRKVYEGLVARQEEFVYSIVLEAGKPIRTARAEVDRALTTFRLAVEESTRIAGMQLPVDIDSRSQNYHCIIQRVPVGPCLFITPFNFPLNLVAHKVAPALACGCPFILKPSDRTPITALILGELLSDSGLPSGSWSILPTPVENVPRMVADPVIRLVSFTGSAAVGWNLQRLAIGKRIILELGSNSAVAVEPDADLDSAVELIVNGAFGYSGQSCISVQRIFLHQSIADNFISELVARTRKLVVGSPIDQATDVGPMIDEAAARRIEEWIGEAVQGGAKVLTGGSRRGVFYEPTLLTNVPADTRLVCEEAFGPVAVIETYIDFERMLNRINDSDFGLQAGLFTRDLTKMHKAFATLEVGAVIINDVPTIRLDAMPYGGVKNSGLGREGVHFAIEHMTELKTLITRKT